MTANSLISNHQQAAMLQRAVVWCAATERCSHEVADRVRQWGASEVEVSQIVQWLTEEGYVDDERYARLYCESKVLLHGWGRQKVVFNLRAKGLPNNAIGKAIDTIDDDAYLDAAFKAAEPKWRSLAALPTEQRNLKTKAFLAQRGFTMQEIYQTITNLNSK